MDKIETFKSKEKHSKKSKFFHLNKNIKLPLQFMGMVI